MGFRSRAAGKVVKVLPGGCKPIEALEERILLSLLGQSLYPANYAWNQQITTAPVASNSTAIINNIIANNSGTNGLVHPDFGNDSQTPNAALYGIPYNVVHGNSTPKVSVTLGVYAGQSDAVAAPLLTSFAIEGDNQTGPPSTTRPNSGDSHMLVWDEDNNIVYEFDQASRPSQNSDGKWHASGEAVWNLNTDSFRTIGYTSVDAAGLAILPGLARPDEGLPVSQGGQGIITHALRFTLKNNSILDQFIYPGSHEANPGNTNAAIEPPMGARFRLKASVNISSLSPQSKIIAQAMKDYGLILADNGSDFFISGASYSVNASNAFGLTWNNNDILSHSVGLESLTYSDFEMVNLTPAVAAVSPGSGSTGSTITVTGSGFSGAAGRLKVLFGSTASSSITILDDTHVQAVVPSGSGTVDVRVQSGVSDPGDSQNINSPIWGYGTSPIVPADHFTYTAASGTVSGRVFRDNNSNGTFDSGADGGLANQVVYLDVGSDGSQNNGDPSTTTDANGNYSFTGVTPGNSDTVRLVTQPSGYVLDNLSSNTVTPTAGTTSTVNVAYFPTVYNDAAGDLYTLKLDSPGTNINILVNGALTYVAPKGLPPSLGFNLSGGSDGLTVDLTNGNPIPTGTPPAGGVTFTGGSGTDALTVTAPTGNNTVSVSDTQVTVNGRLIKYSAIESIAVNTGSGNDSLTQTVQPGNSASLSFTGGTGTDSLAVTGGTYTIPADPTANGTASLAVTVGGGANPASVTFHGSTVAGSGVIPYHLASLTVSSNGTATLAASTSGADSDRTLLTTNSLLVTGSLDIKSNSVDVHYAGGATPFPAVQAAIKSGSITSTFGDPNRTIGYADGADGVVAGLATGDILIRYTVIGDVNLDGSVNFSDLLQLAQNYGSTGGTWDTGDMNRDGVVNFTDLLALAQQYGTNVPAASAPAAPSVATSTVAATKVLHHNHKARTHKH